MTLLMKKSITIIIIFTMLFCMQGNIIPAFAAEKHHQTSGQCGDNLTWEVNEKTRTLTISGTGDMYDYTYNYDFMDDGYWARQEPPREAAPWLWPAWMFDKVIICESVTSIGDGAFRTVRLLQNSANAFSSSEKMV